MYCTRCGSKTDEIARFCSQCGNLVAATTSSPSATVGSAPVSPYYQAPRLTRSLKNRRIAGVCAGLGRYFDVDPTFVRILFVALFFFPLMPAIIPYIVCWIVMPLEDPQPLATPVYNGGQTIPVTPQPR
jgi:phage shock protein C